MPSLLKIRQAVILLAVFLPTLYLYAQADPPEIGGCEIFPASNPWNMDVSSAPVDPNSANYIANINANGDDTLHPDFGSNPDYGIPYVTVPGSQPLVTVNFEVEDESDLEQYPIPADAPVEAGDDRHVLVINTGDCKLYELYAAVHNSGNNTWDAYSGAIWDLNSAVVQQRPLGWTSADAAGLPILPGLARCDEAMSGTINHAFRFTVNETQEKYIYPASHLTFGNTGANYPPMGLRFRLKANYDISFLNGQALAIAKALKKYGMMIADNGSNWYISGETNPACWNDTSLNDLKDIPGTAFEVVSIITPAAASPVQHYYTTPTALLTWNDITWATGYQIQVSGNASFTGASILPASGTTFTTATLDNGTYYWRVRALGGGSGWSPTESFIIQAP